MRNLSLMGLSGLTPQLLLGSAGAVIGFGTSWGLSRFGVRPTVGQAAWYANVAAWGTLAGLLAYEGSGSTSTKLQYTSLVLGEATGLALGAWSARRWNWTVGQTVLADSLVLGAGLAAAGIGRIATDDTRIRPEVAIGAPVAMLAAAIAAHNMHPTGSDLRLMTFGALAGGWVGGLLGAGIAETAPLEDHVAQGSVLAGVGLGYLATSAIGAFTEVPARRVWAGGAGVMAGSLLGLGLHMAGTGFSGDDAEPIDDATRARWQLGAGMGALALGTAATAYASRLQPGPRALSMSLGGAVYGAGSWYLAAAAGYHGQAVTDRTEARLMGGLLAGGVLGATSGYVASRYFDPDGVDQATTAAATVLGMSAGLGAAKLLVDEPGTSDSVGVLAGAGLGFAGGALFAASGARLRRPDVLAGGVGLGYGLLAGSLLPTIADLEWTGGRATAGGAYLGLALGAAGATAGAHLTGASEAQVAVTSIAGGLGLGMGLGTGLLWPTEGSRPARIGAVTGPALLAAASIVADRHLRLSDGLGPRAGSLVGSGVLFGGAWGALLAGATSSSGLVGDTPDRQIAGGLLLGTSAGIASGLVLSKLIEPDALDLALTYGSSVLGSALGLGVAQIAWSESGRHDTVGALAGSAAGLVGGALLATRLRLRHPDVQAAVSGVAYGGLLGTLAASLHEERWDSGRPGSGGALVGLALGGAGAFAAAHLTNASSPEVAVPAVGGLFGLAMGAGAGLMVPTEDGDTATSQPVRIGVVAGVPVAMAASLLLDRKLRLSEGLGPVAGPLAASGLVLGGTWGVLLAGAIDPSGLASETPPRQIGGGLLLGTAAGAASGLVLSKVISPDGRDLALTYGASALGAAFTLGLARLSLEEAGRTETIAALVGSAGGLVGGALLADRVRLREPTGLAAFAGAGYGTLIGALAPTLFDETWNDGRPTQGGALVGLSLGAAGAFTAAHLTGASTAQVAVPSLGGLFGLGMGLGAGLMSPNDSLHAARVGTVVGPLALISASLLAEPRLRLSEGLGRSAGLLSFAGGTFGAIDGLLLAGALDDSGLVSETGARQRGGALLFGVSTELAAAVALSKLVELREPDLGAIFAGKALGGALGLGVSMLATESSGRADTLAALSGSMAGLGLAIATQAVSPLQGPDVGAATLGLAAGGLVGALLPSLREPEWAGLGDRDTAGALLAGAAGSALAGAALRHGLGARAESVTLAAVGAGDGALTGLGLGLLLDGEGTRAERTGLAAGTLGGLAVGAGIWPRLRLGPGDRPLVVMSTLLGAWTGRWLPALGHADKSEVETAKVAGGALAGAGLASFASSLLTPALQIDDDLLVNATFLYAISAGAGYGVGQLASARYDAPVWGMLGAGTAGLLLGGALHRHIDLDGDDMPLLTLSLVEGAWLGAWLPALVRGPGGAGRETDREAGLTAGVLGALGLATVASAGLEISGRQAFTGAVGSAIGASIAGGAALASPELHDRRGVGLMLGGTGLGLVTGVLAAPHLGPPERTAKLSLLGGALGASEALLFAWSSRAETGDQYAGAALVGGGIGSTLGLASVLSGNLGMPASAGFAAWGVWMGAFTGSLIQRDAHEITLGGLAGANLGFLGGWGLIRSGVVESRDFGWLSLFGALGTVAGGSVMAPFASRSDPTPILAGLAVGPAVGMLTGALVLPALHRMTGVSSQAATARPVVATIPTRRTAAFRLELGLADETEERVPDQLVSSTDIVRELSTRPVRFAGARSLLHLVDVAAWSPMVGALPAASGESTSTPFIFGVTGLLR